jgi:antitoxin YobK
MKYERLYEEIEKQIEAHPDKVKFAGGVSEEWIRRAEAALGLRFPPSFRRYLAQYGGASIGGEVVNGLLGIPFEDACGPDIVYNTQLDRAQSGLDANLIALVDNDGDEAFYLDLSHMDQDDESPVIRVLIEEPTIRQLYAENFATFLLKRIEFFLSGRRARAGAD